MDHETMIEEQYSRIDYPQDDLFTCQVCGIESSIVQDVFYHINGNLEGIDSLCDECDAWFVQLVTGDDDE